MPPRKRSRHEFVAALPAEEATRGCPLPADLLLEIVARSDAATLIRCAATCKPLRRDIRRPAFIRRACHDGPGTAVPPRLLGFLRLDLDCVPMPPPSFSLAYPAAASLSETYLAPFVSRSAGADAGRLAGYQTLMSRDGLVLLSRTCWVYKTHEVTMCVYDAMTGKGTFFPGPPDTGTRHGYDSYFFHDKFVLLTAADGVGCPFLILSADFPELRTGSCSIIVRTFTPSDSGCGAWSSATIASHSPPADWVPIGNAAVVYGGFVHWIMYGVYSNDSYIFSYNVLTSASGSIELPAEVPAECRAYRKLHLTSSPANGRRLALLVVDKFEVSVWLHSDDGAWALHAVIDAKRIVHSVALVENYPSPITVDIVGSGERGGVVILLLRPMYSWSGFEEVDKGFIVLDLERKEMHVVSKKKHAFLYEIDMASRLSAMKNF
ncbi:hypothetical protein EJB05_00229, partial [Eragrostis curvula]